MHEAALLFNAEYAFFLLFIILWPIIACRFRYFSFWPYYCRSNVRIVHSPITVSKVTGCGLDKRSTRQLYKYIFVTTYTAHLAHDPKPYREYTHVQYFALKCGKVVQLTINILFSYHDDHYCFYYYYYYYYYCVSSLGVQACLCCAPLVLRYRCFVLELWAVRELGACDNRMFACCGLWRFMETKFSDAVGLVPSAFQFSETGYAYYTYPGASTYKCALCVKTLRSKRNDDTPVKPRSLSKSDLPKKIDWPERALVLLVSDSDKYGALIVQLQTVRRNGVCTVVLIKSLFWHCS
jgi:hypothetical protein